MDWDMIVSITITALVAAGALLYWVKKNSGYLPFLRRKTSSSKGKTVAKFKKKNKIK